MTRNPDDLERLCSQAAGVGATVDRAQAASLLDYLDNLYRWNAKSRLTAVPREDAVRLHLLDSLAALSLLPDTGSVADLGSGAGLPGIVIAVANPRLEVSLIESRRRRCSFLNDAVRALGLKNCRILNCRAQSLIDEGGRFDCVVSRAFLPPKDFLALASQLIVGPSGRVIVMGGRGCRGAASLDAASPGWRILEKKELVLPGGREVRTLWSLDYRCFT